MIYIVIKGETKTNINLCYRVKSYLRKSNKKKTCLSPVYDTERSKAKILLDKKSSSRNNEYYCCQPDIIQ